MIAPNAESGTNGRHALEGADACDHMPSDGLCDDGLYCNGSETCHATLGCQAGANVNCDDGVGAIEVVGFGQREGVIEHLIEGLVTLDDDHLRTRDHDLAHLRLGDLEDAGQHFLFFGFEDAFVFLQEIVNLVSAQGLAFDRAHDAFEQADFS